MEYKDMSKEEQEAFCRKMGDAIMEDYKEAEKRFNASFPDFCELGHNKKEWDCITTKDGYMIHMKKLNWPEIKKQ